MISDFLIQLLWSNFLSQYSRDYELDRCDKHDFHNTYDTIRCDICLA